MGKKEVYKHRLWKKYFTALYIYYPDLMLASLA